MSQNRQLPMIREGSILPLYVDGGEFCIRIRTQVQVQKERHKAAHLPLSAFLFTVV